MKRPTLTEFATNVLARGPLKLQPYQKALLDRLKDWKPGDKIVLIYPPLRVRSVSPPRSSVSETSTELALTRMSFGVPPYPL